MPVLVIGNKNYSSWSLRPWLLLRQFGVAFEEQRLALDTPAFHDQIGHWSPSRFGSFWSSWYRPLDWQLTVASGRNAPIHPLDLCTAATDAAEPHAQARNRPSKARVWLRAG